MSLDSVIAQGVSDAVKSLYGVDPPADKIVPPATRTVFEGYRTVGGFPWG